MPPQITVPPEDFPTGRTVIRLDVGVRQEVSLQVRPLVEGSTAHGTLVRRFLHVEDLVDRQGPGLAEALAALRALEGFFFAVDVPGSRKCR